MRFREPCSPTPLAKKWCGRQQKGRHPHFDIPPQTATTTMFRASRVSASGLELPPSTDRPQRFTTQLGSAVYQFDLRWNDRSNVWTMDISDPVSGNPILSGLTVVLGADLMKPYALGIGILIVVDETST